MRTRIALTAAGAVALSIATSSTVLAAGASGTPRRAAAQSGAQAHAAAFTRAAISYVPGGFLAPAIRAAHRDDPRRALDAHREDVPATSVRAMRAHVAQLERVVERWRAAHPAPPPPPPPAPAPAAVPVTDATSTTTPDWACIRVHESGDRFNTPAAPGGAYGFLESTWLSLGYSGWPYQAPAAVQDRAVLYLYNELGWQPWSTRFVCGL